MSDETVLSEGAPPAMPREVKANEPTSDATWAKIHEVRVRVENKKQYPHHGTEDFWMLYNEILRLNGKNQ